MRKAAAVIAIALLCCQLFAGTVRYVYGSSISSDDFETLPKKGQLFEDDNRSVLAVRDISNGVVVFDKLISRGSSAVGDLLSPRGAIKSLTLRATLDYSVLSFSLSSVYPLELSFSAGVDYRKSGIAVFVLSGARTGVCLSRLWDTSNTFIRNGRLVAWCEVGAQVYDSVAFAVSYGTSYCHNIGSFRWELGFSNLSVLGRESSSALCLAVGVDI